MIKEFALNVIQFIKGNIIICLIAFFAISMVIPPLPFSVNLYYVMLGGIFLYMMTRRNIKLNIVVIIFIATSILSIVFNQPPAVFKSWDRLGLLVLVIGAMFPMFQSRVGDLFHFKLLYVTLCLFILVGCISFIFYLLGINFAYTFLGDMDSLYIPGAFGGVTMHSMILGPLSTFGTIFLFCKLIFGHYQKTLLYLFWTLFVLCVLSVLVSASRSALMCVVIGITLSLYFRYSGSLGNFLQKFVRIFIILCVCYPLYSSYTTGVLSKQQTNVERGGTFSSRDEKWTNRKNEFIRNPLFGVGFASIDLNTAEGNAASTRISGTIEPGSSWLAALSMTGIVGAIPFYFLVFGTLIKLIKRIREQNLFQYVVLTVLLTASIIHQFAEGYAFAGGSYLCFYFWLLLGACVSITSYENQTF